MAHHAEHQSSSEAGERTPRKLPRQARSRALVDAILDATAALLVDTDGELVTTNAIAAQAGVSIGSLYQYFPNRESIIAAVAERHADRVYRRVADVRFCQTASLDMAICQLVEATFIAHRIDTPLHAALNAYWGHMHSAPTDRGSKDAIRERLMALPTSARQEAGHPDLRYAALVAAEIMHGLAHAAIVHRHDHLDEGALEYEAAKATSAYLKLKTEGFVDGIVEYRQLLAFRTLNNNND